MGPAPEDFGGYEKENYFAEIVVLGVAKAG